MSAALDEQAGPAGPAEQTVLEVQGVTLRFGGLTSLSDVTLRMRRGEILAVIGPNGAGKTSLFNSLTGVYTPQEGRVLFRDAQGGEHSLVGCKPFRVNRLGLARTYQNIRLFAALTALENIKVAAEARQRSGPVSVMLGLPRARRDERARRFGDGKDDLERSMACRDPGDRLAEYGHQARDLGTPAAG